MLRTKGAENDNIIWDDKWMASRKVAGSQIELEKYWRSTKKGMAKLRKRRKSSMGNPNGNPRGSEGNRQKLAPKLG
jgi:hypothetical protein